MRAIFSAPVQTIPGAHLASYTWVGGLFPGVKRPGCGVNHPPPYSTEVKERLLLWAFMACYRADFTLYLTFVGFVTIRRRLIEQEGKIAQTLPVNVWHTQTSSIAHHSFEKQVSPCGKDTHSAAVLVFSVLERQLMSLFCNNIKHRENRRP